MKKLLSFASATEEQAYYGVSASPLRKWKQVGIERGDPFPSGNPPAVVEWYRRNYQKGVPQALLLAAARFAEKPRRKPAAVSVEGGLEVLDQGGLAQAVDRARRIEALYGSKLETALKSGNKAEEELYRGPHVKALQALREVENAVTNIARKRKELIERNAVVAAWTNMHAHLPRVIDRELIAARPESVDPDDWTRAVRSAMDKAFGRLPDVLPEILAGAPVEKKLPELSSSNPDVLGGGSASEQDDAESTEAE